MHRCLQIPEIVHLIIQSLSYPPSIVISYSLDLSAPDREDTNALLSLSLTSKSFLEPCLDSLWSCMDSVEPLLDLIIPPDRRPSLEEACCPTHASIMNLTKSIDGASWNRIHYYTDRIRGLRVKYQEIKPLLGRALSTWLSSRHGTTLLRNLSYLHWHDSTVGLYPCLEFFSGPNLTTLKLTVEEWPEDCDGLLYLTFRSLGEACPSLTALEVEDDSDGCFGGSGRQLSLILSAFPYITRVGFWIAPNDDTVLSLATMPNLHTVIHRFYPYDGLPLIGPALPRLQFPALRVLRWCGLAYTQATTLLSLLQPGPRDFQALSIRCEYTSDAGAASALLAAVRATCAPQTLTSLALHSINASSAPPAAPIMPALAASALAASLCPFMRMQECQITGLPIALDDQLLGDLSASWPALRRLELVAGHPEDSTITLAGLQVLPALCPRLEHLELEIGACWPEGGPAPVRSGTGHRAQTVVVYCAHLEALQDDPHEGRRTAWVRSVFPHAQVMLVDGREPHSDGSGVGELFLTDAI